MYLSEKDDISIKERFSDFVPWLLLDKLSSPSVSASALQTVP